MSWAAIYLLKQAALYSAKAPQLNWKLNQNKARLLNVPIVTPRHDPGEIHAKDRQIRKERRELAKQILRGGPASSRLESGSSPKATIAVDPTHTYQQVAPDMSGEMLAHELDESQLGLRNLRAGKHRMLLRLPPELLREKELEGIGTANALSNVRHMCIEALLRESNRIAQGELSPEAAQALINSRKKSREYKALHQMGIQYGTQSLPEGGRAWNRALARANEQMPFRPIHTPPVEGLGKTLIPGRPTYMIQDLTDPLIRRATKHPEKVVAQRKLTEQALQAVPAGVPAEYAKFVARRTRRKL